MNSDTSTLLLPLTLMTNIATAHGSNLMEQIPNQTDELTARCSEPMLTDAGSSFRQASSSRYQTEWTDFLKEPERGFNLTEETRWKILGEGKTSFNFSGRFIGGCLDTIACLVGSPYGDVPSFVNCDRQDGVIVYLENCEMNPCTLSRALWHLRLAGWLDNIFVNGAMANVNSIDGRGTVVQEFA